MKLIHLLLVGLCPVLRPSAQEPIPTPSTIVHPSALHLPITRRGGRFSNTDVANLTYLLEELTSIESRYSATRRVIKGNRVVRKPKPVKIGADGDGGEGLLGSIGKPGGWFADLQIGTPAQHLQMDLDMLSSDFWIRTTGDKGSKGFDEIFSSTYRRYRPWFDVCLQIVLTELTSQNPTLEVLRTVTRIVILLRTCSPSSLCPPRRI